MTLSIHGQRDGLAGVEDDDGVGIDGGDLFDELVLLAGKTEDGLETRPEKDDGDLGVFGGGDGLLVVGLALLGRVPVQPHLHRRVGRVGAGLDLDGVRAGGEFNRSANVVETVSGGNGVVLVGLQNVAMHTALVDAGSGEAFAVEHDDCVGSHGLQIDPVVAGMRRGQGAFPGDDGVGRKSIAALRGEVELRVKAWDCRRRCAQGRVAVVAEDVGGDGGAGHVVVNGESDVGVAGDLLHGVERADLALGQADGALAVDADGVNLGGGGADEDDGVEFCVLSVGATAFVLQEHGSIFAGLLDDFGVGFDGLLGDCRVLTGRRDSRSERSHRAHGRRRE